MFEKEAKRCADEYRMSDDYSSAEPYDIGYTNGLEIGFEKGAEFGYNKANEWHYVKDGDLPKEGTVCLTARTIISGNVAYDVCSYYEGLFGENWFAWKEIILPKEMKEK